MDFVNLIKFVIAWEKREQCDNFKEYTSNTPVVHFMVIVTISEKTFWWTIPSCTDILSERWLRVNASTRAEIRQFHLVIFYKNIFSKETVRQSFSYGLISLWNIPFLCM